MDMEINKITTEFDGQEFTIANPIITDTICEYDEEHRCVKSETNVNLTLVGGNEEKRETSFYYEDNGFRTVSKSTNEDKEAESIVTHDDKDRILKIETPISITEYNYVSDEEYYITVKDIVGETITEEKYLKIDGKDRQVAEVVKRATGEMLRSVTHNYVLDKDKFVIKIMAKGDPFDINIVNIYKYSTNQLLYTTNGFIGNYTNAKLKYIYDDKNRIQQIQVLDDEEEPIDIIDYKIEEIDEHTSVSRCKYESILVTEDEHLQYQDIVMFKPIPEFDQDVSTQHIIIDNYTANIDINIAVNEKKEIGRAEQFAVSGPELEVDITKIINDKGECDVLSYELEFKIDNKQYYLNTDFNKFLTKVVVTTYNDFGSEDFTKDLTFKTSDNDKSLVDYILSKFKEYIKSNETLQRIIDMSKVRLDI